MDNLNEILALAQTAVDEGSSLYERDVKAAGARVRKALQELKVKAHAAKKESLEYQKSIGPKKKTAKGGAKKTKTKPAPKKKGGKKKKEPEPEPTPEPSEEEDDEEVEEEVEEEGEYEYEYEE